MHEVGIMQSVLQIAEEQARKSGAVAIHEIRMRVGRMTGVVLESLEHAFAVLKDGTLAEEARLVVDEIPGTCWCAECDREFEAEGMIGECPACLRPSFEIRRGRELEVVSLEVD
jgi:hydrogenase nickel incorporation protein HypA/HybF